ELGDVDACLLEAATWVVDQLAAFEVHQAEGAGDLGGDGAVQLCDDGVHPEGLSTAELRRATHPHHVAGAQLAPEADPGLEQHRGELRADQVGLRPARLLHHLEPGDLGVLVIHRVVQVPERVALVVPDFDLDFEWFVLAHSPTVCSRRICFISGVSRAPRTRPAPPRVRSRRLARTVRTRRTGAQPRRGPGESYAGRCPGTRRGRRLTSTPAG